MVCGVDGSSTDGNSSRWEAKGESKGKGRGDCIGLSPNPPLIPHTGRNAADTRRWSRKDEVFGQRRIAGISGAHAPVSDRLTARTVVHVTKEDKISEGLVPHCIYR